MTSTTDRLDPPICDEGGYCLRERDLTFLDLGRGHVELWRKRLVPLGLSELQYAGLKRELAKALRNEQVDAGQCDVRLQGSSSRFFSAGHKRLPTTRDELIDVFREQRNRLPDDFEVDEIERRLREVWVTDGEYPRLRPFDSLWRLSITREPSDLDLQISSDVLVDRCVGELHRLGQRATEARVNNRVYSFVRKDLLESALPHLYLFSLRMSDALSRHVSLALFPSSGPPDVSEDVGALSAHFRDTDWVLPLLNVGRDDARVRRHD